ncbi:hypothetical protein BDQ12DRAFT_685565 [Crucibulum laeve]|uniref:Uncharacterized protein n=1 Tax=Crucibulum laeve TaxID=68775 RepID=A0A5C3LYP8_9AGAR|nr:hypothetical protein BDQ12DRAFT_685565 [Crucibulum laeve]
MAQRSPHTPSATPAQSKRSAFASSSTLIPGSARRSSTSSLSSGGYAALSPNLSVGATPSPSSNHTTTPAGSGIPAFRSLRSLLPFGPGKNATPISASVSPSPNASTTSRSPFASFGSVRRSMTKERERQAPFPNDILPIISIGNAAHDVDDVAVRRSVSLSRLEKPLPSRPMSAVHSNPFHEENDALMASVAPVLRTPSPGPPLSAELSTIIEADTSGLSKQIPNSSPTESRSPSPPGTSSPTILNSNFLYPTALNADSHSSGPSTPNTQQSHSDTNDADTSALDLSTTHLAAQVREAMQETESSSVARAWRNTSQAVIIDGDVNPSPDPDASFDLDALDPDLQALLSPNSVSAGKQVSSIGSQPSPTPSPVTPIFASAPSSTNRTRPRPSGSLLPRLRSSNSSTPSPTTSTFPNSSPGASTFNTTAQPSPSRTIIYHTGDTAPSSPITPIAPSPVIPSTSTPAVKRPFSSTISPPRIFAPSSSSTFSAGSAARVFGRFTDRSNAEDASSGSAGPNGIGKGRPATRTLRQVMLGTTGDNVSNASLSPNPASTPPSPSRLSGRASLDARRPILDTRGSVSLDTRRPNQLFSREASGSPERDHRMSEMESPQAEEPYYRPSLDSTATRPSFDSVRPSLDRGSSSASVARFREREGRTPSERFSPSPAPSASGSANRIGASRNRKRSMSVQEKLTRGGRFGDLGLGMPRPGSSMSANGRRVRGGEGSIGSDGTLRGDRTTEGPGPKPEWLGPRTVKAFRAAGLLDFERSPNGSGGGSDMEMHRERSGSTSILAPPSSGGLAKFSSLRSASEYNPSYSRAHSRMAFSEAGVTGRRGSESFGGSVSTYGGDGSGLMESPTFTTSSGSRDRDSRDTPRSASTAPTSISGSSFGYLGRDRGDRDKERERDKEELRELKEKHSTETAALLGALSDSQRTVRILREENEELRDRLERLADADAENGELRRICGELRRESADLRRELAMVRANARVAESRRGLTSTPIAKQNGTTQAWSTARPSRTWSSRGHDSDYETENLDSSTINSHLDHRTVGEEHALEHAASLLEDAVPSSSTPAKPRRRYSTSSSIFPVPPPNMTMLLYDDPTTSTKSNSDKSSIENSFRFSIPSHSRSQSMKSQSPLASFRALNGANGHTPNKSITSNSSISPTTANFSLATSSPGSLSLKPEHEMLLDEMESLDLGVRDVDIEDGVAIQDDDW